MKELIARGDLQRCLVVCPGSLVEQWQDELYRRFQLSFEILTNDKLEAARTGNWFLENNLVIARLDKLSRNQDVQFKLQVPESQWDLDYRRLRDDEPGVDALLARPECAWITRDLEQQALAHAVAEVVPEHLRELRERRSAWIDKARAAVKDRLTKEIGYWDLRAESLKLQEQAGRPNARLNSQEARRRADDLQARLQKRLEQLDLEAQISALPPVALGGLVVLPAGLLAQMTGRPATQPADTQASAARARAIVVDVERKLGFDATDREYENLGYDIESREPGTGRLRFLEVKGRISGAATITVTKNEILYSLNKPEDFILAIVEFLDGDTHHVHYLRRPFQREPDFGVTSVNYDFAELLARAKVPT